MNIQKSYCGIAVEPSFWDLEGRRIDPDKYVEFAKSIHANAIRVGFFGHTGLAYYPSEIAPRAPGLNGRDLFKEFQDSCKKHNIVLVPYLNTHFDKSYYEKHPESVAILGGEKGFVEGTPLVKVCLNNPDYRKYTFSVAEEMVRKYNLDIVYVDSLKLEHLCTCGSCAKSFREKTGLEIPDREDWGGTEWDAYVTWYQQRYLEIAEMCALNLRKIKPSLELISNRESFYNPITSTPEFNANLVTGIFDGIHAEAALRLNNQTYSHMTEQCYFGQAMKTDIWLWVEYVSGKWMYLSSSSHEMKLKIAKVLAGGARPNIWTLSDMDEAFDSAENGVAQIYSAVEKYPEAFNETERFADVAQLYSTSSAQYYIKGLEPFVWPYEPDKNAKRFQQEFQGMFRMSLFSHQLSTFILDRDLNYDELSKYKLLILPNTGIITPERCSAIRRFVYNGGGLIATYESSLYDEKGCRLKNFMLADLFGADFQSDGPSVGDLDKKFHVGGYLKPFTDNSIWGKGDALFPAAGRTLDVEPRHGKPMAEFIYPGWYHLDYNSRKTGVPSVICNDYGKGRAVYLPYEPGYAFSHGELPQMLDFFSGIIQWVKKGHSIIKTNLPPTADIFVRKAKDGSIIIHLINIPGSDRAEISQEPLPVKDITISLKLPIKPRKCKILTGEKAIKWNLIQNVLKIELKGLKDYTVIQVN